MSVGLVQKYARPVPRYTSYPTAPHFHAGIANDTYHGWLEELPSGSTLSLYFHIPYCDRLCWFCGCHTKQIKRYDPITKYLVALHAEISAVSRRINGRGRVTSVHLGGGSPTMLSPPDMSALAGLLGDSFDFDVNAEISVEMDPNDMDEGRFGALATLGMTRASLGVQDFDPKVQVAVNRIQTFEQTREVVLAVRARGARSVNLDMLYGLPHQTIDSVLRTSDQVLSLEPDRIALFGYAHVPWMKKHQNMIDEAALPDAQARFEQSRAAARRIVQAGFVPVGIDHFARPGDSLAISAREGRLHRNFQGYTIDAQDALLGFGASSIGQLPQGYVQNIVATAEYERQVLAGGTAIAKGIAFTPEDKIRAYVIERLMCDFGFSVPDLQARFGPAATTILREMKLMISADADGLVRLENGHFSVTERGRPFVRSVAAGFDAYLLQDGARYSIAV